MKDLENLQPEEQVLELLDMLENQQTGLEEKDKTIQEQKAQVTELLDLNEKLNNENSEENVQALKNDLKRTKESLQSERKQHQADIGDIQGKLTQALVDRNYAETHQKVVTHNVEVRVPYEKCVSCDRTTLQKTKAEYTKAWKRLDGEFKAKTMAYQGVFSGFVAYALLITVLMAIRTQSFVDDVIVFFQTVWNGITETVYWIQYAGKQVAALSGKISNPTVSIIIYWVLLIGVIVLLVAGMLAVIWFVVQWISGVYKKYCWDGISVMVVIMSTHLLSSLVIGLSNLFSLIRWYYYCCCREFIWSFDGT